MRNGVSAVEDPNRHNEEMNAMRGGKFARVVLRCVAWFARTLRVSKEIQRLPRASEEDERCKSAGFEMSRISRVRVSAGFSVPLLAWILFFAVQTQSAPYCMGSEPWQARDIGVCPYPIASGGVDDSKEFSITTSGSDVWGGADSFRFVFQGLAGDGEISTEIVSLPQGGGGAKTMLMFRSGADEKAQNIALGLTADGRLLFQSRERIGGATGSLVVVPNSSSFRWLRLRREGAVFSAFASADGVTWLFVGRRTLQLPSQMLAGIAVSGGSQGILSRSVVRNPECRLPALEKAGSVEPPVVQGGVFERAWARLTWSGARVPEGVAGYEIFRDGIWIASVPAWDSVWHDPNSTRGVEVGYSVAVKDSHGRVSAPSAAVKILVPFREGVRDASLNLISIGEGVPVGELIRDLYRGTISISGKGIDAGGSSDSAQFFHGGLVGDGAVVARLARFTAGDSTARCGVMFRDGTRPDATNVALMISCNGVVTFQCRSAAGGTTVIKQSVAGKACPQWLKIVRSGDNFYAFVSEDASGWLCLGSQTIAMSEMVSVGIAACSRSLIHSASADLSHLHISEGNEADRIPPEVPALVLMEKTSTAIKLGVSGARDDTGLAGFLLFRGGVKIASLPPWTPSYLDQIRTPGESAVYSAVAIDAFGNHSVHSPLLEATTNHSSDLAPWTSMDFGKFESPSSITRLNDVFTVCSPGRGMRAGVEEFHLLYRKFVGDVDLIARISAPYHATAGLMLRTDLDSGSPLAFIQVASGVVSFRARSTANGGVSASPEETASMPGWFRLKRKDGVVAGYRSADGKNWKLVGVCSFPEGRAVYGGLASASGSPVSVSPVTFDALSVVDTEQPLEYSEPTIQFETVSTQEGARGVAVRGRWLREGAVTYCSDLQGSVEFAWNAPAAAVYRIMVAGKDRYRKAGAHGFALNFYVDDVWILATDLLSIDGQVASVECLLPWIDVGTHRIRVEYVNSVPGSHLQIEQIQVQVARGEDLDQNGTSDWTDRVLSVANTVDFCPETSRTSPVCIEGAVQNLSLMTLNPAASVLPALAGRWYANVPLTADGEAVPVSIRFDRGRSQQSKRVRWASTNVLDGGSLSIRKGDSLLLTMRAPSGMAGDFSLEVSDSGRTLLGEGGKSVPYAFEKAGVFTVKGSFKDLPATRFVLTIRVVDASLPRGIVAWQDRERTVDCAGIGTDVVVDGGAAVKWTFQQSLGLKGRRFRLRTMISRPAPVLARLYADGPILDHAVIEAFDIANCYTRMTDAFQDGSVAVDHYANIRGVLKADMEVRFEIFAAGVLFEDGRRVRELRAGDFDSAGFGSIRMIVPKGVRTSVCHLTRVFQAGVLIGQL